VREAGAQGFIAKPFQTEAQTEALVKAIRESLPQAEELKTG
jgi:FixJ family two-component response regulator